MALPFRRLARWRNIFLYICAVVVMFYLLPDIKERSKTYHVGVQVPDVNNNDYGVFPEKLEKSVDPFEDVISDEVNLLPAPDEKSRSTHVTKIIVMAYYRGGSSYLGQILNQNPSVFYWYEPFSDFMRQYKADHPEHYSRESADVYVPNNFTFRELTAEATRQFMELTLNLLNCRLDQLPDVMLRHTYVSEYHNSVSGSHLKTYRTCMKYKRQPNQTLPVWRTKKAKYHLLRFEHCKPLLQESCDNLRLRGFKTIRMTMTQIKILLDLDPDIKVIYSTRDPRGMANSRFSITQAIGKDQVTIGDTIKDACVRVRQDIDILEKLPSKLSSRILRTNFETIVADLSGEKDRIMKFLGLDEPKELGTWVSRQLDNRGKGEKALQKWRINGQNSTWWNVKECEGLFVDE